MPRRLLSVEKNAFRFVQRTRNVPAYVIYPVIWVPAADLLGIPRPRHHLLEVLRRSRVREIISVLRGKGLSLKLMKYHSVKQSVDYLGHCIC